MLQSGDWVTARLDGVPYLEKGAPWYWEIAVSYLLFGVHDWSARVPGALATVLLCWLVARFGEWAFGEEAGLYAGLCIATCVGLFLFTRILIPDCTLTLAITASLFSMLRLLDDTEKPPGDRSIFWPMLFWSSMAVGVLLKGVIAVLFPAAIAVIYLIAIGRFLQRKTWQSFRPVPGLILFMAIAAPWHVLATIRNPPTFDFAMHSESGSYRGFFWFYFINEHVLRFLNRRYPRDYDTVPRGLFWVYHLLWLFPWSFYLPSVFKLKYRPETRASSVRLLAVIWVGVVLIFFSISTTQEYYTMPSYPAMALLIGSALASGDKWLRASTWVTGALATAAAAAILLMLYEVRNTPAPGDISAALTIHPEAYSLSLGHMNDLTLQAFAYLRWPLIVAAVAFAIGAAAAWIGPKIAKTVPVFGLAVMMVVLFHAARLALVRFDPYLSSRPLAEALIDAPDGQLIVDNDYYDFSSVFFYTNRTALLLNARRMNLEYGSYAPGAPNVFIDYADLGRLWSGSDQYYLLIKGTKLAELERVLTPGALHVVKESGGKYLFTNR
jgi:4-amino-4-deoxy-L-arabinose transferase-like glycosyltransferase